MKTPLDFPIPPKISDVSHDQLSQFRRDGYLAFSDVLGSSQVAACREALGALARSTVARPGDYEVRRPAPGRDNHAGASFSKRGSRLFIQIEPGQDPARMDEDSIGDAVRKYMWFADEAPIFREILGREGAIHRTVSALIGENPLLFQEMALVKPPFIGSEKPWHQDNAYFSVSPLDAIAGVWIALDDASPDNGCMHVIPGGHKLGPLRHFHGSDCEIAEGRLDTRAVVPVPVPAGGALFFYGLLPHETPPNRSPMRRRALQFHYRSAESKIVDEALYNTIFAEADGTPASCKAASRT